VKKIIGSQLRFAFLLGLVIQAGCISRTRVIPQDQRLLPAKSADKAELLQMLEQKSRQIQTMNGTVSLDVTGGGSQNGVLTEYRQTKGYVLVERPANFRIKVLLPLVGSTAFDLVSDGQRYHLSIPAKNQWAEGEVNAPINSKSPLASLRPKHFLDGLFVDIIPYLNKPQVKFSFEEAVEGRRSFYVFTFMEESQSGQQVRILEKLWIDRNDSLEVTRKQVFRPDGKVETDVKYSNYRTDNNVQYPEIIEIQRPIEEYTLKMTFQKTTFNQKLRDNTFNLERPEGSQLVQMAQ
jgi:outer membrane lipoprotein-sorting protein